MNKTKTSVLKKYFRIKKIKSKDKTNMHACMYLFQ